MCCYANHGACAVSATGIRVNDVAPGPIWTPLIPATFPRRAIPAWQSMAPMKRAGQPCEVGGCRLHSVHACHAACAAWQTSALQHRMLSDALQLRVLAEMHPPPPLWLMMCPAAWAWCSGTELVLLLPWCIEHGWQAYIAFSSYAHGAPVAMDHHARAASYCPTQNILCCRLHLRMCSWLLRMGRTSQARCTAHAH